ncbi:DUF262 domain-containing protein [Phocaeicola sartorii]|uniref:DUF262 domain-containing protein n=1 Tax=Phocaeicola sartorii TaxID=671267 RepID=UPI0025AA0445|nr:DUF262 domain-containing protein [Phocaeicola sartorii]
MTTEIQENFRPKSIAELIDDKHLFVIPSFQRGYRWEEKQVSDLLEDIIQFANDDTSGSDSYFLQPVVVRPCKYQNRDAWEVLDGQQRLTTLLLILKRLMCRLSNDDRETFEPMLFEIVYTDRPSLDFDNPDPANSIDSYYLSEAKVVIDDWFEQKRHTNLDGFKGSLLYNQRRQVKLIWYAIDASSSDRDNINIFNRLNKGKIALTSAELIKALFIMDNDLRHTQDPQAAERLALEWNEMECRFQDDKFWYFISNNDEGMQTRMDILFDFVTCRDKENDSDYSYREFQKLYDHCRSEERKTGGGKSEHKNALFDAPWAKDIRTMEDAWRVIKRTFDRMIAWYEDNLYYHYIGYLVFVGFKPLEIYNHLEEAKKTRWEKIPEKEWSEDDTKVELRKLIMERFKVQNSYLSKDAIDEFEYGREYVRRLLLLFNVETCLTNCNSRFDFERFKNDKWDVEHIDSQNDASLQEFNERINWLEHVEFILGFEDDTAAKKLRTEASGYIKQFKDRGRVEHNKYVDFYARINRHYAKESGQAEDDVDLTALKKDHISNLTLLDCRTNREYQDAPFPYKRYLIMKYDREGERFIPTATRNVFLKYYTDSEQHSSHLDRIRWNKSDREGYLKAIHRMVDPIFDSVVPPVQSENTPVTKRA